MNLYKLLAENICMKKPCHQIASKLKYCFFSAFLVIVVNKSESAGLSGMQCYIGNCTTFEDCRRPELISDCPNDKLYDACLSVVVQKGNLSY